MVYSLAEHWDFAALKEEIIRERLVVGVRDTALSERLQMDPSLTLEKGKKLFSGKKQLGTQSHSPNQPNDCSANLATCHKSRRRATLPIQISVRKLTLICVEGVHFLSRLI